MSHAMNQLKSQVLRRWGFHEFGNLLVRTMPDGGVEVWSQEEPNIVQIYSPSEFPSGQRREEFKIDWSLHLSARDAAYASLYGLDGEKRRLIVAYFHELEGKALHDPAAGRAR